MVPVEVFGGGEYGGSGTAGEFDYGEYLYLRREEQSDVVSEQRDDGL